VRAPAAVAALAIALLASACAGVGGAPRAATQEEERAYAAAASEIESDPQDAARRLESFVQVHPESPLADDAAEELARLAEARGDTKEAMRWLRWLADRRPPAERADAARVELARLEAAEGNPLAAKRILEKEVRWAALDDQHKREGYRLLASLAEDPVDRLAWLEALRAASPEPERARVDGEIVAAVAALPPADLERAADRLREGEAAARVRLRLAELALGAGDAEAARRQIERAGRLELSVGSRAELDALSARAEALAASAGSLPSFEEAAERGAPTTDGASGTIGVVLPLTGDFARYGEAGLRGVLLAAGVFAPVEGLPAREEPDAEAAPPAVSAAWPGGRKRGPGAVRVLVRDSGGSAERAARAVRELAAREDVVAVVGPLLSREAEGAARVAEEEKLPLLTLAASEDISRDRDHVFRLRTGAVDEIEVLVEYVMGPLVGARRFGILYPKDAYGRVLRRMFWSAVERRGGEVVAVSGYDTGITDFATPIRRLAGYALLTDDEKRALAAREKEFERLRRLPPAAQLEARQAIRSRPGPEGRPLPPIVDFDALFIPDTHQKIVLIAPQLAFHEVNNVQLVGPDGWDDPALVRMEGRHVRGALVATPFFAESRFAHVADFVGRYRGAYGSTPDAFAAAAYDAASLVLVQLARGTHERERLRDGVLRTQGYPGVSGVTTILPDGSARKRPFLLRVESERFVGVD
jgi:ABC-type branched-subunit amino acid transport system substrate-binding protein